MRCAQLPKRRILRSEDRLVRCSWRVPLLGRGVTDGREGPPSVLFSDDRILIGASFRRASRCGYIWPGCPSGTPGLEPGGPHPYQSSPPGRVSPGSLLPPGRMMHRWRPLRTARFRWGVDQRGPSLAGRQGWLGLVWSRTPFGGSVLPDQGSDRPSPMASPQMALLAAGGDGTLEARRTDWGRCSLDSGRCCVEFGPRSGVVLS
jgi:hypothetical protein